jgi:dihydropteridine reductase
MSKTALVFGGSGALGRALISHFKSLSIVTINIDYTANPDASTNISPKVCEEEIMSSLDKVLGQNSLDSIINVSGGWAGGNAKSEDLLEKTQLMFDQSVKSSVFATSVASKMLKESGLLVFVGAAAALDPTPGMLAYGMAKASVHHLVKSLGALDSGLPKDTVCTGICPVILDTPNNRKWMPNEDFSSWTPLQEIAQKFGAWTLKAEVPVSGGLYKLVTVDHVTTWNLV